MRQPSRIAEWLTTAGSVLRWRRHRTGDLLTTIEGVYEEMQQVARLGPAAEQQYLELGGILRKLSQISTDLMEESERLVVSALGQDQSNSTLRSTLSLVERPLTAEADSRHSADELLEGLEFCERRLAEIRGAQGVLQQALSRLRVVQVLFRVEAAGLGEESQRTFQKLSGEILALEEQVSQTFEAKFRALTGVRDAIGMARQRLDESLIQNRRHTELANEALQTSTVALSNQITANQVRDTDLVHVSQAIASEINNLIMALQSHDIVTQKLDHLRLAATSLRDDATAAVQKGEDQGPLWRRTYELAAVHGHQLQRVEGDVRKARKSVQEGAEKILELATRLDAECIQVGAAGDGGANNADTIQALLNLLSEGRSLCRGSLEQSVIALETVKPLRGAADDLNDAISSVSYRIRLLALNAQIEAEHRGEGTGLAVLAASTAEISREAASTSDVVKTAIEEVNGRLQLIDDSISAVKNHWESLGEEFDTLSRTHETELHSVRDQLLGRLRKLSDAVETVRTLTTNAMDQTNIMDESMAGLSTVQCSLKALAQATSKWAGHTSADGSSGWMADNYTMASERHAHEAALGGATGSPPEEEPSEAGEVELF